MKREVIRCASRHLASLIKNVGYLAVAAKLLTVEMQTCIMWLAQPQADNWPPDIEAVVTLAASPNSLCISFSYFS